MISKVWRAVLVCFALTAGACGGNSTRMEESHTPPAQSGRHDDVPPATGDDATETSSTDAPAGKNAETRALYVSDVIAPRVVRAGDPILVVVRGDLPNPGWKFLRWEVRREGDMSGANGRAPDGGATGRPAGVPARDSEDGTATILGWVVTPLIVYTLDPGQMVAQVTVPFDGETKLDPEPAPGVLPIDVRGFESEPVRRRVDIVAANALLDLEISGGFAGIRDRVSVMKDGAIIALRARDGSSASGRLSDAEMTALRAARDAARLSELAPRYETQGAADLFLFDLVDWGSDRAVHVIGDDMAMPAGLAAFVSMLREKGQALLADTQ
jgi:hypothetical protein